MKRSEIYLKAAKMIVNRKVDFSCVAVVNSSKNADEVREYCRVMNDGKAYIPVAHFNYENGIFRRKISKKRQRLHRSLALLFMAEYVESEEL